MAVEFPPPSPPDGTPEGAPGRARARRAERFAVVLAWLGLAGLAGLVALSWKLRAAPLALTGAAALLPLATLAFAAGAFLAGWRWPAVRPPAALAALAWALVWGRAWWSAPDAPPPGAVPVRVLSWNLQRLGFEAGEDAPALACAAAAVDRLRPDVLALQEVSGRDADRLERRLGLRCRQVDYGGTGGEAAGGLAACLRGARARFRSEQARPVVPGRRWFYVFAEVEVEDALFNLMVVHLPPYPHDPAALAGAATARRQGDAAAALLDRLDRLRDPTVVAGDFNSPRDAALHAALRRRLRDAWEVAAWGPGGTRRALGWFPVRVDYVYATPGVAVTAARRPAEDCSDHRPVVVDLALPR